MEDTAVIPDIVQTDEHEEDVLVRGSILSIITKDRTLKLYRVLGFNDKFVSLIPIGTKKAIDGPGGFEKNQYSINLPPKLVRERLLWTRNTVDRMLSDSTLERESEVGRPEWMDKRKFEDEDDPELAKRRRAVAIVEKAKDEVLWDAKIYSKAVQIAAKRCGVGVNKIRRWFETHLFYGRHANALVPRNDLKGAPGSSRAHIKGPLGSKTKLEKSIPGTPHKRSRLTRYHWNVLNDFIEEQAWETNDPFKIIFRRFLDSQVVTQKCLKGFIRFYPKDMTNFPDTENTKRIGRRMLARHRFARSENQRGKPGKRQLGGGSAQALVHDLVPVWDIDATQADNYILFDDEIIAINGVAKPTVIIAVDRASNAITGWDVTYRPENGDAYLNCILSGYTSKIREMRRWKVPFLRGLVHGCTSKIFLDRGPGTSKKTQDACNHLELHSLMAVPGDPAGKGHIERVMRFVQEALAYLTGSTFTTGDPDEDRKRRLNAKKGAVTMEVYMQALLMAISRHNLEADVTKMLTVKMTKEKVLASPVEIYRFNKGRRRGDAAWDWAPEDVLRKLCVEHQLPVVRGRVKLHKRHFSSPELRFHARYHTAVEGSQHLITAYEIPNAPFLMLWDWPGVGMGMLDAEDDVVATYEDGFAFSVEAQNIFKELLRMDAKMFAKKDALRVRRALMAQQQSSSQANVSQDIQKKIDKVESKKRLADPKAAKENADRKLAEDRVNSILADSDSGKTRDITALAFQEPALEISIPTLSTGDSDDEDKDIFIDY